MSTGNFPEIMSREILVGIILVGRLGVKNRKPWSRHPISSLPPPLFGARHDADLGSSDESSFWGVVARRVSPGGDRCGLYMYVLCTPVCVYIYIYTYICV